MRLYKKGKSYYIDYSYRGKRHRKSLGTNKKIAKLTYNDIELRIEKEQNLGILECKKVLFEDFAEEYLKYSKANKKESSYQRDIYSLRANLVPYFKGYYLTQITPQMIEEYKTKRLEKDQIGPACLNRELSCIKNLYSKAILWQYAVENENPMKKVKLLKEPPGRVRYLQKEEYYRLIKECSHSIRPIVIIALNTGMRKQEILSLRAENIFLNQRKIIVRDSKNNESRIIPMNNAVYTTLKKFLPSSGYIFSNGNGGRIKYIDKGFKAAVKRANIEDFRIHDCRHHFASHLALNSWNLLVIQRLLGVKSLKMVKRYTHLSEANLQDAVNSLDKSFRNGTNMAQEDNEDD